MKFSAPIMIVAGMMLAVTDEVGAESLPLLAMAGVWPPWFIPARKITAPRR